MINSISRLSRSIDAAAKRHAAIKRHRRAVARFVVGATPVGLLACSLTIDADRQQCAEDSDCRARGGEFSNSTCDQNRNVCVVQQVVQTEGGEDTGVVGLPEAGPSEGSMLEAGAPEAASFDPTRFVCADAPGTPTGPFTVTLRAQDLLNAQKELNDVTALLCRKLDVDCTDPLVPPKTTVANEVTFEVPANFNGYVQLEHPDYLTGLYHFNPPVNEDRPEPTAVQLATPGVASGLVGAIGVERRDGTGIILLNLFDCNDDPIAGARLSSDQTAEDALGFYVTGGAPQPASEDTLTDTTGYGGYVNTKPGFVVVNAALDANDFAIGTLTMLVKADAISYGSVVPNGG